MNKYDILGIVGEGAYGYVYKAKNKDNGNYGKKISPHSNLLNKAQPEPQIKIYELYECLTSLNLMSRHHYHPSSFPPSLTTFSPLQNPNSPFNSL